MTKTKPYYLHFLLLLALPAHAQLRYELKVAPLWGLKGYSYEQVLSRNTVEGSFEWLLGKKFGVEAGVAHCRNRCVEPYFRTSHLPKLTRYLPFSLLAFPYPLNTDQLKVIDRLRADFASKKSIFWLRLSEWWK